jgi:ankyrin repeat protein
MGACWSDNNKISQERRKKGQTGVVKTVEAADFSIRDDRDAVGDLQPKGIMNLEKLIVDGDTVTLEQLIKNNQLNLNEHIFDSSKTALHVALQNKHRRVVELFLQYKADVNKEELQTGNTALFFVAADLNEEYVRLLLDNISKPDLGHRNAKGQDIVEFLNNWFYKSRNRELNERDRNKLNVILSMLREYKERYGKVEHLDMSK